MKEINSNELLRFGEKWLQSKIQRMKNLLIIADHDEALYREIMLSLGYPKNKVQFLELALMFPYSEFKKMVKKEIIEKALLFRAGLSDSKVGIPPDFDLSLRMDKSVWEYKGIRPANFPEARIKGIANLLAKTINQGIVHFFYENIKAQVLNKNPKIALKYIMSFEGIGIHRKEEIFFNIILPFFMCFSESKDVKQFLKFMFKNHPPLSENKIIKEFKKEYKIKISTVQQYMGVIYSKKLYTNFNE